MQTYRISLLIYVYKQNNTKPQNDGSRINGSDITHDVTSRYHIHTTVKFKTLSGNYVLITDTQSWQKFIKKLSFSPFLSLHNLAGTQSTWEKLSAFIAKAVNTTEILSQTMQLYIVGSFQYLYSTLAHLCSGPACTATQH